MSGCLAPLLSPPPAAGVLLLVHSSACSRDLDAFQRPVRFCMGACRHPAPSFWHLARPPVQIAATAVSDSCHYVFEVSAAMVPRTPVGPRCREAWQHPSIRKCGGAMLPIGRPAEPVRRTRRCRVPRDHGPGTPAADSDWREWLERSLCLGRQPPQSGMRPASACPAGQGAPSRVRS
jgi:hypothetical protein